MIKYFNIEISPIILMGLISYNKQGRERKNDYCSAALLDYEKNQFISLSISFCIAIRHF